MKLVKVILLILVCYSLFNMISSTFYNEQIVRLNSGERLFSIDTKMKDIEKLNAINSILLETPIDTNFSYSFSNSKFYAEDSIPYCIYLSAIELDEIKDTLRKGGKDKNPGILYKKNPELKRKISAIDNLSKQKKKKIDIAGIGNISFCLEDTMKLNESYRALLIVSREISEVFIQNLLQTSYPEGIPKTTKDTMTLSKRIFASLLPAMSDNFTIIRAEIDTIKNIDLVNKDYITWEWIVTPTKIGENKLILKLSRVETPKGDLDKFYPSKIITVQVTAIKKSFWEQFFGFLRDEWKWLLSSIVAIAGWYLVYKQNKRKNKAEQQFNTSASNV